MDKKLLSIVLAFALAVNSFGMCADAKQPEGRAAMPNIVFLLADDLGWTGLRCFGSDFYETPELDALAANGMKFTDAYAACTVCSPTRASIMTGMYPARLKCTDFIAGQNRPYAKMRIPDWTKQLKSEYVTIAEVLQSAGYQTGHIGKWHLEGRGPEAAGSDPLSQGFDISITKPKNARGYFIPRGDAGDDARHLPGQENVYVTDWLTEKACGFIEDSREDPFFLYFAYHVPHTPIQGRPDLVKYFEPKVKPNAVHNNPVYAAMVASLDRSVGRIQETLEQHNLSENTIVIFISDNGGLTQRYGKHDGFTENIPLRRGKGSAYEGGVRVPAIICWPGKTKAGSTCAEPIMTIDFYPTILAMAGLKGDPNHNESVDGRSLVDLLQAPNERRWNRDLFWHYPHYHAGGDGPYSAIRSGNMRLIEFHEDQHRELYDLSNDIGEQQDLAEQLPEVTQALTAKLHQWRESLAAQMPTINPNFDPQRQTEVRSRQPSKSR